ncbi:ribosome hibernation-promoting factor, HPF/YfiA family [Paraferrimonas sedimenticola]|uniref:Ribosomal subunit interface protein n=1 Tax=Paraferrimonas sedimenticola TaxID=375674 RepID=A0AA37RY84_9GAMM|nr:ribosome-associated translation inhibitor RaiA [Paraferrimonas sedimenticola]GLP97169.1 ribosomal subunit interface protein [Paraferrimonas sedimenticola]
MIKITSKQFNITDSIRDRLASRFEKLAKHDIPLNSPHVIITQERQTFKIEAKIQISNGQLFAQAKAEDLYVAINALGQKLERQINKITHKSEAGRRQRPIFEEPEEVSDAA